MSRYFSPGKLLLSSEYAVLDGALALAVATKPGQELVADEKSDGNSKVFWSAKHQGKDWLSAEIDYRNWEVLSSNNPEAAEFVVKVLRNLQRLSEEKFHSDASYHLTTNLEFPADYGLGSSSTLMTNLSKWAGTDAFALNEKSLGGSGYDVAVAMEEAAILYRNSENGREIEKVEFSPEFRNELIFIHLNQKQNSREGIGLYRAKEKSQQLIDEFSELTMKIYQAETLAEFSRLMEIHEKKLSDFLQTKTAKALHFADCPAFIKSLGAWGGDFVMSQKFEGWQHYFSAKGFKTIFEWDELIL